MDMYWSMIIFSRLLAPRGLPLFIFPWLVWASVFDSLPYARICFSIIQIVVGWFMDCPLNWTLDYEVSLIRRPGHRHNIHIHEEKYEHNDLLSGSLNEKTGRLHLLCCLKMLQVQIQHFSMLLRKNLEILRLGLVQANLCHNCPLHCCRILITSFQ